MRIQRGFRLSGFAAFAAAMTSGLLGSSAVAAESQGVIEEIIVTGSYIRGTPEDAALPVDVITAQELE
ncbi:MAG: hypothetical protein R3E86_07665 [Pseudomonadales bacterium]